MKVRMKIQIAGTRNGLRWPGVGGDIDLTDGEAVDLISQGYAEEVAEAPAKKAAAKPEPEKATAVKPETRKKS